jgi:hypothetical protein
MKCAALALFIASFIIVVPVPAQTIRVAPATELARETDPKRFSEPHLAIDPANPNHLFAGVFISWVQGTLEEMQAHQRCASFVSCDRGATWDRHEFSPQVAILPDGQAVFIAAGELAGVQPHSSSWLIA